MTWFDCASLYVIAMSIRKDATWQFGIHCLESDVTPCHLFVAIVIHALVLVIVSGQLIVKKVGFCQEKPGIITQPTDSSLRSE